MAITVAAALEHAALKEGLPELRAGDPSRRVVRWVHTSEIYDIAPLLRGGELLLTTGLGLAGSGPDERRRYVRALAEREIAGLALELGDPFGEVPEDMVEEARRLDLPLIVLTRVYPFVEVAEQINSAILDSSIVQLRHADEVGRALSRVLGERGGLEALATTLADIVARPVVVTDAVGAVVASSVEDPESVHGSPATTAAIIADGTLLGGIVIGDGPSADDRVIAAIDRAPEIFAIELLRGRSRPLLSTRERRDLLGRLLAGAQDAPVALAKHAEASRIRPDCRWAALAVAANDVQTGLSVLQGCTRDAGTQILAAELDGTALGLVAIPATTWQSTLQRIRTALERPTGPVVALGPVVTRQQAGRSLRTARQTLDLASLAAPGHRLLEAEGLVPERVMHSLTGSLLVGDLVDEQLGSLLGAPNAQTLLATLEAFLESGCSKAQTARVLHLRRQSVHQRLNRLTEHLGHDLSDPRRQTALRLALAARRLLVPADAPS